MKRKNLLAALFLMGAGVQNAMAQKMVVTKTDNSKVVFDITEVKEVAFEEAEEPDEHEWVDLGLPSGTLWATCNVGASSPEEYGDYFAWGETGTKSEYNWSSYFDTEDGGSTFKKYNNNGGLTELQPEDDAATVNWGCGWRTPSLDQINELYNSENTTTEWTQLNGVNGRKITGKNGNSIFLPAAGCRNDASLNSVGAGGTYWSCSLNTSCSIDAYGLSFGKFGINWYNSGRCLGYSVRPVRVK